MLNSFKSLNKREKKNSLTLPSQNNTLFRAVNFLKDSNFYSTDAEFIRNSTPTSNATPSNAARNESTIIHQSRVETDILHINELDGYVRY